MTVSPLSALPRFTRPLVEGFFDEWPGWCNRAGRPAVEAIFEAGPADSLPAVLVAHDGDVPLGTIALRRWFGDEPMPETPWVRQFYVFPRHRGRGVGDRLLRAVQENARSRSFERLHVATSSIEPMLTRRGWEVFRRTDHDGEPMAWLRKMVPDTTTSVR